MSRRVRSISSCPFNPTSLANPTITIYKQSRNFFLTPHITEIDVLPP